MNKEFDVVIIGGGPGGYVAAIRAAQLGNSVACIEGYKCGDKESLGGTCLNVGCIPSKVLLETSEHFEKIPHLEEHGIYASAVKIDIEKMQERKDGIVSQLTSGIEQIFKANKVEWIKGFAKIESKNKILINKNSGETDSVTAKNIIIAVGSVPIDIPSAPIDQKNIVDSTGALSFKEVPKHLGVIGAGVIGLELGSVWRRLGAEVTVFEASESFLPYSDKQVAKEAARHFKRQGLDIKLGAKVTGCNISDGDIEVNFSDKKGDHHTHVDKLLVSVGRKPNTKDLFINDIGVQVDERGFIKVDKDCKTVVPNIFAIGDCVRGPMLAHKASEEGIMVAEIIAGQKPHVNLDLVPYVTYTQPEIASVGKTEEQLKEANIPYKKGDFPFAANGRAKAMDSAKGFVKILAHAETDEVLGAHIIGPMASEMIHELILAMEYRAASEDIVRMCHAHPSLSEAVHEAALSVSSRAIHKLNK